jgi:hypothetical protein
MYCEALSPSTAAKISNRGASLEDTFSGAVIVTSAFPFSVCTKKRSFSNDLKLCCGTLIVTSTSLSTGRLSGVSVTIKKLKGRPGLKTVLSGMI